MFGGSNKLDEEMLRLIGLCNSSKLNRGGFVEIYDARPLLNARANKLRGGGYEDCGMSRNYQNCRITFADIENIHDVRESFEKLYNISYTSKQDGEKFCNFFLTQVEGSQYRQVLSKILQGVHDIL